LKKRINNFGIKQIFITLLLKKVLLIQRLKTFLRVFSKNSPEYIAEENKNIKLESMVTGINFPKINPKRVCIVQIVYEDNDRSYIKFVDVPFHEFLREGLFKYNSSKKNYKILFEIVTKNIAGIIIIDSKCLSIPSNRLNKLLLLVKEFIQN
jgi:hypothetical protein